MAKKVIITGGSGFVGTHLSRALLERGYKVSVFDLRPPSTSGVEFFEVNLMQEIPQKLIEDSYAIIHLAGKNIFSRWDDKTKKAIYDSRIVSTRNLVLAVEKLSDKPEVFISASATGIYGDRGEESLDENSPPGRGFLARVSLDWEKEAREVENSGLRSVQVRTAPVLGEGGFLQKIIPFYKWGLGGSIGNGKQWFSWIHIKDLVEIYILAIENRNINGSINGCSPEPARNKDFSDALSGALRRPAFFRIPKFLLRLLYGEVSEVIVASQRVYPKKALDFGYKFYFPDVKSALRDIFV